MTKPENTEEAVARPEGHCADDKAWLEFSRQYAGQPRSYGDMTDFALANAVFMASRDDLSLIHYQTAAKERIRWLSLRLASALSSLETRDARIAVAEAENVKLRALAEESIRLMTKYAREAGEATGKLETSELAGVVDDWKARALKAEARLAEAVGALREVLSIWDQWGSLDSTDPDDRDAMEAARQALSSVGEG